MSTNKSSTDMAMEMATDVMGGLGKLGLGLAAFASEKLRTSPEDQLRANNLSGYWGTTINKRTCPNCEAENEFIAPDCFLCGQYLWTQ